MRARGPGAGGRARPAPGTEYAYRCRAEAPDLASKHALHHRGHGRCRPPLRLPGLRRLRRAPRLALAAPAAPARGRRRLRARHRHRGLAVLPHRDRELGPGRPRPAGHAQRLHRPLPHRHPLSPGAPAHFAHRDGGGHRGVLGRRAGAPPGCTPRSSRAAARTRGPLPRQQGAAPAVLSRCAPRGSAAAGSRRTSARRGRGPAGAARRSARRGQPARGRPRSGAARTCPARR